MASATLNIANLLMNTVYDIKVDVSTNIGTILVDDTNFAEGLGPKLAVNDIFVQSLSDSIVDKIDAGVLVSEVFSKEQYVGKDDIATYLD